MTEAGLAWDGKLASDPVARAAQIQATSDDIARNIFTQIKDDKGIPQIDDIIKNDASLAVSFHGQTVGGWAGAFYYWDAKFTQPNGDNSLTVGQAIMSDPAELEKFIAINAQALLDTSMRQGLSPNQLMTGWNAQAPGYIKAEIASRAMDVWTGQELKFTGDPYHIDGYVPVIGADERPTDWRLGGNIITDPVKINELNARYEVRIQKGNDLSWQELQRQGQVEQNPDGSKVVKFAGTGDQGGVTSKVNVDANSRVDSVETAKDDGTSAKTVFDTGTEPWSSETSAFDAYQRLQSLRVDFDGGNQQTRRFDNTNNRLWDERDIATDPTGNVTNVQLKLNGENQTRSAADPVDYSAIGQIFGSAIGRAIVGKDGNPFVSLTAGTVAGFVGQKFVQALINGPDTIDLAQLDLADVFFGKGVSLAGAGLGAASSFLTAEIATSIGLNGVGAQMFNAAVGGYLGSVLDQVRAQGFNVLTAVVNWNVALHASELNIASAFGSFLAHQFVHPESQFGAVGGQLAGAVGSALAYSFSVALGEALNVFLPGVGAFFGTIIGTLVGDAIAGDPRYPKATNEVQVLNSDPNHFTNRPAGHDDGGNLAIAQELGDQVTKTANSYLDAVHGAAIYYSGKVMIGYNAGAAPYQYITGWYPNGTEIAPHFASATDAIQEGVRELLQNTEVFGGDLLVKRAHQAFINGPHANPNTDPTDFTDLGSLGGDLRTAQDYEQYLNDRETINALIEQYPNSAFTAGWAATFARVHELGLDKVHGSDFIGGVVGWLDSVDKAGLGAEAANATVKLDGTAVTVEVKIANGAEVPGALSVFADTVSQSSDATGTTVRFVFNNGLAVTGFQFLGAGASGTAGNDILTGGAGNDTINGGDGWDFIDGGAGADTLDGGTGNDILRGGTGNDTLNGGQGDDTYAFARGDGADTVYDDYRPLKPDPNSVGGGFGGGIGGGVGGGTLVPTPTDGGRDTLAFGVGISLSDITATLSGNNLILGVKDPAHPGAQLTDTITLQDWKLAYNSIELFRFADGSTLDLSAGQSALTPYQVPFGESLSGSSVVEKSTIGTKVGTVSGFDFNPNAVLSYSLLNPDGRFAINGSTGVLTVAGAINYDPANSPKVTVQVSDGAHVFNDTFTINVIDVPEVIAVNHAPTDITLSGGSAPEDSPGGTIIATAHGVDPDLGTTLHYSLTDDAGGRFTIYQSGEIAIVDPGLIDYETASSYDIKVKAADQAGLSIKKTFTLHITDVYEGPFGFKSATAPLSAYAIGAGGWTSQDQYPRQLADVNGDGMADIVAFGGDAVIVSLATGGGHFVSPMFGIQNYTPNSGGSGLAQDHENYPSNRQGINALIAANVSMAGSRDSCRELLFA